MKKTPFVTKEQLEEIVKEYPTPFHLYDEAGIRKNAQALKDAFAWNKGFREYFAVKATPNPFIMNILREYGCGYDCSSLTELMLSEATGVQPRDIMFSSNDTPAEEFAYADKLGAIINLDDITHIDYLEETLGHIPEIISCRYNPGGLFKISNDIMDNPGDAKYGMTTEQIFDAFRILKSKGAKEFGIHAFLASNTVTNEYYPMLAKVLFELAVKLQKETGAHVKFINLSGGIGIPYKPDQEPNDIAVIGEGVRKVYEEVLVQAEQKQISLQIDAAEVEHYHLIGSPLHIRQIFQNIIENAVKFNMDSGSVNVVCRELASDENTVELEMVCADTGIGMSEEFQKHVFEAFVQEDTSARTTYSGIGLGLAITKKLVN